jgi:hypothetical protein
MRVFELLSVLNPEIRPKDTKIHLATPNKGSNPLDVYLTGEFDEWQRWQNKKNFERKFVLSLIRMKDVNKWLFAGLHCSGYPKWYEEDQHYYYELTEDKRFEELNGRLVVSFHRPGRQPYLNAEKFHEHGIVSEILAEQLSIGEFPGFREVNLTFEELKIVVRKSVNSWRTALASVAGVYLISDTSSGDLYIGSAYGEGGIWQRWNAYVENGHGGNVELKKLLKKGGIEYANKFRYSILEIADVHALKNDILKRETHWKDILMSRAYGLNVN